MTTKQKLTREDMLLFSLNYGQLKNELKDRDATPPTAAYPHNWVRPDHPNFYKIQNWIYQDEECLDRWIEKVGGVPSLEILFQILFNDESYM